MNSINLHLNPLCTGQRPTDGASCFEGGRTAALDAGVRPQNIDQELLKNWTNKQNQ